MSSVLLTLQANQRGAWRNCLEFSYDDQNAVLYHASNLAWIVDAKLRVLDSKGKPVTWWTRDRGWHNPLDRSE